MGREIQQNIPAIGMETQLATRSSLSGRFRLGSNYPLTGYYESRNEPLILGGEMFGYDSVYIVAAARNTERLPAYARLDLRLDRTFAIAKRRLMFAEVTAWFTGLIMANSSKAAPTLPESRERVMEEAARRKDPFAKTTPLPSGCSIMTTKLSSAWRIDDERIYRHLRA